MQKKKLGFVATEKVIVDSEIVGYQEMSFYTVLKSFRNSRNKRCFPSMNRVSKRLKMSIPTCYRCRRKLRELGLITWNESHGGRKNHVNYRFILLDGSDTEIKRVLENLGQKKLLKNKRGLTTKKEKGLTTKKSLDEQLGEKEGVNIEEDKDREKIKLLKKNRTNYINKINLNYNNKDRNSNSVDDKNFLNLENKLKQLGVKQPSLGKIIENYDVSTIEKYLRWLPYYREVLKGRVKNEAGLLVSAILNNRGAPERLKLSSAEKGVRGEHTTEEWEEEEKRLKEELGDTF